MKTLVTGVNGQLGYDVAKALIARGHQVDRLRFAIIVPPLFMYFQRRLTL